MGETLFGTLALPALALPRPCAGQGRGGRRRGGGGRVGGHGGQGRAGWCCSWRARSGWWPWRVRVACVCGGGGRLIEKGKKVGLCTRREWGDPHQTPQSGGVRREREREKKKRGGGDGEVERNGPPLLLSPALPRSAAAVAHQKGRFEPRLSARVCVCVRGDMACSKKNKEENTERLRMDLPSHPIPPSPCTSLSPLAPLRPCARAPAPPPTKKRGATARDRTTGLSLTKGTLLPLSYSGDERSPSVLARHAICTMSIFQDYI